MSKTAIMSWDNLKGGVLLLLNIKKYMKLTISLYASICLSLFIGCTSKSAQKAGQIKENISQNNETKVLGEFPNTDTTLQVAPPIKVTPPKNNPIRNDIQYNIT